MKIKHKEYYIRSMNLSSIFVMTSDGRIWLEVFTRGKINNSHNVCREGVYIYILSSRKHLINQLPFHYLKSVEVFYEVLFVVILQQNKY